MENIIIKKDGNKRYNSAKLGKILPLFFVNQGQWKEVEESDFPNSGDIFVTDGYDEFSTEFYYEIPKEKLVENTTNFSKDLVSYNNGDSSKNPSKWLLNYHKSNSLRLNKAKFIPIFKYSFNFDSKKILGSENINFTPFFLYNNSNQNEIIGPFDITGNELKPFRFKENDDFENDDTFLDFLENYTSYDGEFIFKIKTEDISNFIVTDRNKNNYITDFQDFIKNNIGTPIYFSTNSQLKVWINEKLKESIPNISDINSKIQLLLDKATKVDKFKYEYYKKYIQQLDDEHEDRKSLAEILNANLTVPEDTKLLREIEELKTEVKIKNDEIVNIKNEVQRKENDLLSLNEQFENLKNNSNSVLSDEERNQYPVLSEMLNNNKTEIEEILKTEQSINILKIEEGVLNKTKKNIESDINKKSEELRNIEQNIKDIHKNLKSSLTAFKEESSEHITNLFKNKLYGDLLNGISPLYKKEDETDLNTLSPPNPQILSVPFDKAESYITEIQNRLNKQGRQLDFNEVANLIITIQQSFITIIAGASGVGKTSLVEKIAKSYGLDETFGYLEVACARGWSSSKDLIGFFNPLSGKFQSSKTKLKDALDKSSKFPDSPYIILLDEANLSPIEHYWSDFIKSADTDYTRKIKISDYEELEYGQGFRFVATINYDHTTEPLSNRLIDRAAIIQLQKGKLGENKDLQIDKIFNFESVKSLFKETKKWSYDSVKIMDVYAKISNLLEDRGIIISNRKHIIIENYCKVATGLLEGNNDYTALDYAIAQHILPIINGRGEKFELTLNEMEKIFADKEMEISRKLLKKIIERGKEFNHFRYIYY